MLLDNAVVPPEKRQQMSSQLVAHLGQNMRFVLDSTVDEFLHLHAHCRGCSVTSSEVLALTNEITPEPVLLTANLNELSGGQSRALMIADIALICDSPVVLIDEIENAGIDKERALQLLQSKDILPAQHCTASKRLVYLPAHRQNGWKRSIRKNFSLCIQSIYLVL